MAKQWVLGQQGGGNAPLLLKARFRESIAWESVASLQFPVASEEQDEGVWLSNRF
jgi:hypothetical protein